MSSRCSIWDLRDPQSFQVHSGHTDRWYAGPAGSQWRLGWWFGISYKNKMRMLLKQFVLCMIRIDEIYIKIIWDQSKITLKNPTPSISSFSKRRIPNSLKVQAHLNNKMFSFVIYAGFKGGDIAEKKQCSICIFVCSNYNWYIHISHASSKKAFNVFVYIFL